MKDKFDTGLLFSNLFIFTENFFCKGLTAAVFILVGKWPNNIEVLMIWVSVGSMSSRLWSRRDVSMGSKAHEVGFELFILVWNCVIVSG